MPSVVRHKRKDSLDFFEARSDEAENIDYIEEEAEDLGPEGAVKNQSKINLEYELEMKKRDIECLELVMKEEERKHVDKLVFL